MESLGKRRKQGHDNTKMSRLVLCCAALLIFIVITSDVFPKVEGLDVARRKTGSSSSRSSSSSGSRSSSRSGSSGGFGSKVKQTYQKAKTKVKNVFKKPKKPNNNPQSSYPKQQYTPVKTNTNIGKLNTSYPHNYMI